MQTAKLGRLPVVNFAAGELRRRQTRAPMHATWGGRGVCRIRDFFKSSDPKGMAQAIVEATVHFMDAKRIAKVSENLGKAMPGLEISTLETKMASRGV